MRRFCVIIGRVTIGAPFGHVAEHVAKSPGIEPSARRSANGQTNSPHTKRHRSETVCFCSAGPLARASPRGILPFGLGRQAIAAAGRFLGRQDRQSATELPGVVPDLLHGRITEVGAASKRAKTSSLDLARTLPLSPRFSAIGPSIWACTALMRPDSCLSFEP